MTFPFYTDSEIVHDAEIFARDEHMFTVTNEVNELSEFGIVTLFYNASLGECKLGISHIKSLLAHSAYPEGTNIPHDASYKESIADFDAITEVCRFAEKAFYPSEVGKFYVKTAHNPPLVERRFVEPNCYTSYFLTPFCFRVIEIYNKLKAETLKARKI